MLSSLFLALNSSCLSLNADFNLFMLPELVHTDELMSMGAMNSILNYLHLRTFSKHLPLNFPDTREPELILCILASSELSTIFFGPKDLQQELICF